MHETLAWAVRVLAAATMVGVPLYSARTRGPRYAWFGGVVLGLSLPGAVLMHERLAATLPPELRTVLGGAFVYAMVAVAIHMTSLVRARLRPPVFRLLVSIPGQMSLVVGFFSGVWLLLLLPVRAGFFLAGHTSGLEVLRWADLVPLVLGLVSLVTSTRTVPELVRVALATDGPETVQRVPLERYRRRRRPAPPAQRPLRIVQITDPHLGPWQPVRKLERHLRELVAHAPDLVLLTGDFLTMEGRGSRGALADALAPLQKVSDRSFAIFGNHDHEDPDEVRHALETNGIRLLVDEEARVATAVGPVQIVGADYVGRGRERHIPELLDRYPRREGELRIFLLHDPLGFQYVPRGDVDLTLSGHTHGGHVGLVSFGLDWTVMTRTRWPDHGLFGHGSNRLYVHRGTGFYGFPLRVGVPGESSLLEVLPSAANGSAGAHEGSEYESR